LLVKRQPLWLGLASAAVTMDAQTQAPAVVVRFDAGTVSRLATATRDNIGQVFVAALNHEVIAAAIIREPILDGAVRLSGRLTLAEARDIAMLLRAGTPPSRLTIVEREIVVPGAAKP
jgi:preprotein translocase subunit SecD